MTRTRWMTIVAAAALLLLGCRDPEPPIEFVFIPSEITIDPGGGIGVQVIATVREDFPNIVLNAWVRGENPALRAWISP